MEGNLTKGVNKWLGARGHEMLCAVMGRETVTCEWWGILSFLLLLIAPLFVAFCLGLYMVKRGAAIC